MDEPIESQAEVKPDEQSTSGMRRGTPTLDPARKARVEQLCEMVRSDIKHWDYAYTRMREWRRFARGIQWPGSSKKDLSDPDRDYVANVTMRHLKQRTASIYAKNPTYEWRRSKKVFHQFWDGTMDHLERSIAIAQSGMDQTNQAAMVVQEAARYEAERALFTRLGETITTLYSYFIREQNPPMKKMAKKQVLASLTNGVAYFKQTFQRATGLPPDVERAIADHMAQISRAQAIAADLQDDKITEDDAKIEELQEIVASLEGTEKIILREGLAIDYPDSLNIIPDRNMTYLPGFVGCGHVTEQYVLTPDEIKRIYKVDVEENYRTYAETSSTPKEPGSTERATARVWEIWDKTTGLVCTVCDGYPDYLVEPTSPVTYTERFWPWFVYAPNAVDDEDDPFPPSDVELMMPMQMEINRAGESLRDHRYASRPGWVAGSDIPLEDKAKMEGRAPHAIVVLKSLSPDEDIRKKFQEFPRTPIDPNLYSTQSAFTDVLRAVGSQEANLGGTSGATATESSIAESSRQSTLTSAIDEFDDLLTEMARAGGQILFQEMSPEKVKEIVGPGAVWPDQTRDEVAREIHLEVVAGSSGRPNRAQEVAVIERLYPLLFQLPKVSQERLAKQAIKVLDDGANYEDWLDLSALSVLATNGTIQAASNKGEMEGEGGANNAERPPEAAPGGASRPGQAGTAPENVDRSLPKGPGSPLQ